jgi:hypothetical protein
MLLTKSNKYISDTHKSFWKKYKMALPGSHFSQHNAYCFVGFVEKMNRRERRE